MSSLILIEHHDGRISPACARVVAAARKIGAPIEALVAGYRVDEVAAQAARLDGVSRVLVADDARYADQLAEPLATLLAAHAKRYGYLLAAASTFGKDVLPRAAALAGVGQISEVIEVVDPATFKRPIHAGALVATVRSDAPLKVLSIRATAFESVGEQAPAPIETVEAQGEALGARFVESHREASERPELTAARVVVSGGRGLGSKQNFSLLEGVAGKLDAAIGASRAAVDAGYVPNELQVGQTGKIVAPDLYIAVGISGAMQHLAGMQGAKVIVAINRDEEAPIFQVADYGLVGDLFELLPELERKL